MNLGTIENAGDLGAACIGDQRNAVPALFQLARQSMGRDHVTAGATGRQDEMFLYAHPLAPFII